MVCRARLRTGPGAVAGGAASRELPAVPAAPEARQLLGRAGHGEDQKPAVQQLAATSNVCEETSVKPSSRSSGINRRVLLSTLATLPALSTPFLPASAPAQTAAPGGLLPSWNDGPAKQAILDFVRATSDRSSPSYVVPEDRIAVFDQDGTLWVEQPMYTQVIYCLDRVPDVVAKKPELKNREPFKTVLSGNREAIARLPTRDL